MSGHAAHAVMQQDIRRAGRAWAAVGSNHSVGRQRHLHLLGFEPLVEILGRALGEDLDQRHHVLRTQPAQTARELQVIDEIANAARWKLRRRGEQQALHHLREALDLVFVSRISLGVAPREFGNLGQRLRAILPHEEVAAIGERGEERRVFGVHLIAVALQLQLADDALLQQAGEIRAGGDAIARPDFFGDRAAAQQFAPLKHEYLAPRPRQIRSRNQPVVAAAYDYCIVLSHSYLAIPA